jgi:hypothetical protein
VQRKFDQVDDGQPGQAGVALRVVVVALQRGGDARPVLDADEAGHRPVELLCLDHARPRLHAQHRDDPRELLLVGADLELVQLRRVEPREPGFEVLVRQGIEEDRGFPVAAPAECRAGQTVQLHGASRGRGQERAGQREKGERLRPAQHVGEGVRVELADPQVQPRAVRIVVEGLCRVVVVRAAVPDRLLELRGRANALGVLAEDRGLLDQGVAPLGQVALHPLVDIGLGEAVEDLDDVGPVVPGHVVADRPVHVLLVALPRRRDVLWRALHAGGGRDAGVHDLPSDRPASPGGEHARDGGVAVRALEAEHLRHRRRLRHRAGGRHGTAGLLGLELAFPLRHPAIISARSRNG